MDDATEPLAVKLNRFLFNVHEQFINIRDAIESNPAWLQGLDDRTLATLLAQSNWIRDDLVKLRAEIYKKMEA